MRPWPAVALAAGLATCWAALPGAAGIAAAPAVSEAEAPVEAGRPDPLPFGPARPGLAVAPRPEPARAEPRSPEPPAASPDLVDLRVEVVDAETGRVVPGAAWRIGNEEGLKDVTAANGSAQRVTLEPGVGLWRGIAAVAPAGFVAWDAGAQTLRRQRYARSLRAVHPLRREVSVVVDVRDFDGRAARDPQFGSLEVAGRSIHPAQVEALAIGRFRLRGVPFLRREPLRFGAWIEEGGSEQDEYPVAESHEVAEGEDDGAPRSVEWVPVPSTERPATIRCATWRGRIPDEAWQTIEVGLDLPPPEAVLAYTGRSGRRWSCSSG